ncbi:MAG: sigma-70 family RNA polymerase sigma factor [Sedimentisphaerales bacterium]|nr:sigma-70 family RNA polymerase sigma factor [Sedimentisphaerales bacterium]MBN2842971.1 sigma-70 family RNA polymerase sigma factor [Sedimentisphaerales bacterium]
MSVENSKQFMGLLLRYQTRIHTYILYQIPNRNDAEDILQDTIVTMLDKFSDFQEGTNFLAWGITIARYKILNFKQSKKSSRLLFDDELVSKFEQESEGFIENFQEEAEKLRECIVKLPPRYKNYLRLRYEQSMSYREIGKEISISMQAVHKTMARIHVALLKCLGVSSGRDLRL